MTKNLIECFEGEQKTLTITVRDESTGAVKDLTGYTVVFYAHSSQAAQGTNIVGGADGKACTVTPPATNGIVTCALAPADLALSGTLEETVEGTWQLKLTATGIILLTRPQPFILRRNLLTARS